ncbi:putative enzyme related to lactoylglutathione lyase [Micromonospora sp. Llam0]|uniref:VOC family protein n=1 Tax=Micromonospora sp. Llam0 TaxID=2485143 RepID=UPI000FBCB44F|nr:VOC family protein [Micromonospora sp. Llam0]ROO63109.1 putative enzyme related to lactoylglutathione lyase [Micromonospora sp. Llam0]
MTTTRRPAADTPSLGTDGEFCWMDIKTRDIAGTARFFSATLGWHFAVDDNDWRRATTITVGSHRIGTVSDLAAPIYPPGTPPHIAYYLAVDDVDRRVAAATTAGAQLIVAPFDIDQGRIATLIDPFGAPVSLWHRKDSHGWRHPAGVITAPHRMILGCPRPDETRRFYQETLGTNLHNADLIRVRGAAVATQWQLVVTVDGDLDGLGERATRSGGDLAPPITIPQPPHSIRRLSTSEGVTIYTTAVTTTPATLPPFGLAAQATRAVSAGTNQPEPRPIDIPLPQHQESLNSGSDAPPRSQSQDHQQHPECVPEPNFKCR